MTAVRPILDIPGHSWTSASPSAARWLWPAYHEHVHDWLAPAPRTPPEDRAAAGHPSANAASARTRSRSSTRSTPRRTPPVRSPNRPSGPSPSTSCRRCSITTQLDTGWNENLVVGAGDGVLYARTTDGVGVRPASDRRGA